MPENQIAIDAPSTARMEAFSDGVFAIVITLLVLDLGVPSLDDPASTSGLARAILQMGPKILSFVLSFFLIAIFWANHHQLFHGIQHSTRGLLWLNTIFLLFVTIIPFPTAILGAYPTNRFAVIFFGSVMFGTSLTFIFMRWYASMKANLIPKTQRSHHLAEIRKNMMGPILYSGAMGCALLDTRLAIAIYFLVPLVYFYPARHKKEKAK